LFHETTGYTPAKYIMKQRINGARVILSTSDLKIETLAEKLCFCSTSHFIQTFKRLEGITPEEFRKQCIAYQAKGTGR